MQHDWFMYHLRSTYKNRLDFPFKGILYQCFHFKKSELHGSMYASSVNWKVGFCQFVTKMFDTHSAFTEPLFEVCLLLQLFLITITS